MRVRRVGSALLCVGALVLGCKSSQRGSPPATDEWLAPGETPYAADPVTPPPAVSLYFAASEQDADAGSFTTQFPLLSSREILAVAYWQPRPGLHVERIEYHTPDGALYRSIDIPFTTDTARGPAEVAVPGRIGKVPVQHVALAKQAGVRVIDRLPVSGTPILTNVIGGLWSVSVYYDGEGPLATASFEVQR